MAASLYLRHFSMTSAPFPVTPDTDAYYTGGSRRAMVDAVVHVLRNERGIVKVVGESGTGKTTLCRHIARTMGKEFTVLYSCDPSLADEQIWFALADALRLEVSRERQDEAAALVRKRLGKLYDAGRPALLLLDEAHAMPPETLEQIRLLAQREAGDETFRIMLLGPEELDHSLALPEMDALRTRIAHSVRLKRLTLEELGEYLNFKMRAAGWHGEPVFSPNAVKAIAKLTRGVPRRINVLADKALLAASLERRETVNVSDITSAAKEVRLARRRASTPRWLIGASGFAAGVVMTALVTAFALRSGWIGGTSPADAARAQPTPATVSTPASSRPMPVAPSAVPQGNAPSNPMAIPPASPPRPGAPVTGPATRDTSPSSRSTPPGNDPSGARFVQDMRNAPAGR